MNKVKPILFFLILYCCISITQAQEIIHLNKFLRSNIGNDTMWNDDTLRVYGITDLLSDDPHITASTIYCNEGDSVVLNTLNISQLEHHTIHLHGLDVDTRNDGDPATSFYLVHLQDTTYSFKAKHAGTYLYHCHVGDVVHVQMGMYGLVVVKPAGGGNLAYTGGPWFHQSHNWLLSEIDSYWHLNIPQHDEEADTIHLPPYEPDFFLINGKSENDIDEDDSITIHGKENDFIYLRIGSIGFFTNKIIFPPWLEAEIIDSDGRPLPEKIISDTLYISPGERFGVMLHPSAQLTGEIQVEYINMNTLHTWNIQYVPVIIEGFQAINEEDNLTIQLYPNPVTDELNISGLNNNKAEIIIYNTQGEKVRKIETFTSYVELIVKDLPAGNYFVTVLQSDNEQILPFTKL